MPPDTVLTDERELQEVEAMFPHAEYQPDAEAIPLCAFCDGSIDDHKANCVVPHVHALCVTVRALRTDLKYRCEMLEELRGCRDRWLTMLNPARADMSVEEAITALREQLADTRRLAFRDGRFALMGVHGSTNPDPAHRKGFTTGVNAAIQALEAAAKKEQP